MPDLGLAGPFAFEVAFFLEAGALAAVDRVDVLAAVPSFAFTGASELPAGLGLAAALVGFFGLEGLATAFGLAALGLGAVLTGDLDLERDLEADDLDPFFMFNFSRRRGVTLYDALILVSVPSSTPFLRALRK